MPPPENHTLFAGGRPSRSRRRFTGCSCRSIWISLCQRCQASASGPASDSTRSDAPDAAANGCVDDAGRVLDAGEERVGPRRREHDAVVRKMPVQRVDERVRIGASEVVDDAPEPDIVAPDDERHRVGGEPECATRVDAERGEPDGSERPVHLALHAVVRCQRGGDRAVLDRRDAGSGDEARERRRAARRRRIVGQCDEIGKGEYEVHAGNRCDAVGARRDAASRV